MDEPAVPVRHEADGGKEGSGVEGLHDVAGEARVDLGDDGLGDLVLVERGRLCEGLSSSQKK